MVKRFLLVLLALLIVVVLALYSAGAGWLGTMESAGEATAIAVPESAIAARTGQNKQILFGDLHVHTTFSFDAFSMSLPLSQGDVGSHPPADACDFARYCSALDFWSINDHAEQLTPRRWRETVAAIRQCNAVAGSPENPDTVAFLGWEWTQTGLKPETHFGHKNVLLAGTADDEIPQRPIAAPTQGMPLPPKPARGVMAALAFDTRTLDMMTYLKELDAIGHCEAGLNSRELPDDCIETAKDPNELFAKLDDWGVESLVIPHGTTWGIYTPPGADWRKQLVNYHDPARQTLVEVFSGHGNSEEWIDTAATEFDEAGDPYCPPATASMLPSCQFAGQLIAERCKLEDLSDQECEQRAATARQNYVDAYRAGHQTVPGIDMWTDWLDAGQCRDCFLPTFNYRRGGSVQYMLAQTDFSDPENPRRLNFGFIASSDNHNARPGTGYKEAGLTTNTEVRRMLNATAGLLDSNEEPLAKSVAFDPAKPGPTAYAEGERFASFFYTGGLVAVHADGRSRGSIWDALKRKEVYGTSGPRILLWFEAVVGDGSTRPMGSALAQSSNPEFRVKALGSFKQKPGCPADIVGAVGAERLQQLCQSECYHPADERRNITRIEVVRIQPQRHPDEAIDPLIKDAWKVFECPADGNGCEVSFTDGEFTKAGRDAIYYVRAIEEASDAINGAQLDCEYNAEGQCVKMRDCGNNAVPGEDDCLAPVEQRAWSSPIAVNFLR